MYIFFSIIQIIIIFTISINSEKVTIFNVSPIEDLNGKSIKEIKYNNDDYITIKIVGESSNLYENKEILGHGQVIDGFELKNGKKYIFSKIKEYDCYSEPFFYDEDSGLKLYQDSCHTLTYICKNENFKISTDNLNYIENKYDMMNYACEKLMENNNNLIKRDNDECNKALYSSALAISAAGFSAYISPIGWAASLALVTSVSSSALSSISSCITNNKNDYCTVTRTITCNISKCYFRQDPEKNVVIW